MRRGVRKVVRQRQKKAATPAAPRKKDLSAERAALIETVREWGYFDSVFKNQRPLLAGRRLLDIGMGGGPLSVAAIELAGCASYVGVDPHVGTATVRNPRADKDPSQPRYCAFPYSPAEIMRLYPNIHLYSGVLEEVTDKVRRHKVDMAYMASVTEHIQHLPEVFETIWSVLEPDGLIWLSHHGYHSWTGHHRYPRTVADWRRDDPEQNAVVDWKHLDPDHPSYRDPNFNRVRLQDFRRLIEKYFDVLSWRYTFNAAERLTPELREKHKKYTLEELLGRTATILARRRSEPLPDDLTGIPFFHPPEDYLADADHSRDDLTQYELAGSVFFASPKLLGAHTTNNGGAAKLFARLSAGDTLRISRGLRTLELRVDEVNLPEQGSPSIAVAEALDDKSFKECRTDWALDAVRFADAQIWTLL